MAIKYSISANVVDITSYTPTEHDKFLIDTNVWYWLAYTKASLSSNPPQHYQTTYYPNFINNALSSKSTLYQSALNFSELAHIIEKTEYEIYKQSNLNITKKEFRHNLANEWHSTVNEIKTAWEIVNSISQPIEVAINNADLQNIIKNYSSSKADSYDLFIVKNMLDNGVTNIVSDDGDLATINNIKLFTANVNVIRAAKLQGKLSTS